MRVAAMVLGSVLAAAVQTSAGHGQARFTHQRHSALVAECSNCHGSAGGGPAYGYPSASFCETCHNGTVAPRVSWTAPEPRSSPNLRFDHTVHQSRIDVPCTLCHTEGGAPASVQRAVIPNCLACHGGESHLTAPDAACNTCHLPLARATGLSEDDVSDFPVPPSHGEPGFAEEGTHGALARAAGGVAASCATCHAQDFCTQCHVGEGVPQPVMALEPDARSLALRARPRSHGADFPTRHATVAAASQETCANCHVRSDCLDCHQPGAASGSPGFHPADFLSRHPAAAYSRESSCSDCHNNWSFCADCHEKSGLTAAAQLGRGYHDAKRFFVAGHGQAARQSLESCVACHAERDCVLCHSASGGRRVNPHGPGFDAERLRDRNVVQCSVCHGATIPNP